MGALTHIMNQSSGTSMPMGTGLNNLQHHGYAKMFHKLKVSILCWLGVAVDIRDTLASTGESAYIIPSALPILMKRFSQKTNFVQY